MKIKLCDINPAAVEKLPGKVDDKSGVGVHYVDAFLKPMNAKLPDGTAVKCKRRGLRIMLTAGTRKGDGLLRRLAKGPDAVNMLQAALQEAAAAAGVQLTMEGGEIYLDMPAGYGAQVFEKSYSPILPTLAETNVTAFFFAKDQTIRH